MKKSKNSSSSKPKNKLIDVLNSVLAEAIDLQMQCRQAHWNVRGKNFIALHEFFGRLYTELSVDIDEIAERTAGLGGTAYGSKEEVSGVSGLPKYPVDISSGSDHIQNLAKSFAAHSKSLKKAIEEADDADDDVTEDLLTTICGNMEKRLWLIESHIEGK